MKKIPRFLMAIPVFFTTLVFACSMPALATLSPQSALTQSVFVDTAVPIQPTPVEMALPVQIFFAPACASCPAPIFADTEADQTYCVKKIPYQNFSVEPGTKFEPLDPSGELKCVDSGTVRVVNEHGLKIWTCTGKQLWTYDLKITTPSCRSRMILKLDADHCQAGLMYSAVQNCCTSLTSGDSAFAIIKVNMGACK